MESPSDSPMSVVPWAPEEEQEQSVHHESNEAQNSKKTKRAGLDAPPPIEGLIEDLQKFGRKCQKKLQVKEYRTDKRVQNLLTKLSRIHAEHMNVLSDLESLIAENPNQEKSGDPVTSQLPGPKNMQQSSNAGFHLGPEASGFNGPASRGYNELAGHIPGSSTPGSLPGLDQESLERLLGIRKCPGCCCPNHKV